LDGETGEATTETVLAAAREAGRGEPRALARAHACACNAVR
jgi:hypothetical protein